MKAFTSNPTGPRGCQASTVAQMKSCRGKAYAPRWTGKRWVALCKKHDARLGHLIEGIAGVDKPSGL